MGWGRKREKNIRTLLIKAGLKKPLPEGELEELVRAMEGAMCGPKGTLLEGQTIKLKVIKVDYVYGRCEQLLKAQPELKEFFWRHEYTPCHPDPKRPR